MRFLHSADWHLGRTLHGQSLLEDQAHLIEQFVAVVEQERPDCICLSGDIYDRAIPSVQAVELFDSFLNRVVLGLGVQVIAIAGNHDNPTRLSFASQLLKDRGVHLYGRYDPDTAPLEWEDCEGKVQIYPIPYVEPAEVQAFFPERDIQTHHQALDCVMEHFRQVHQSPFTRSLVLAHAFVRGGQEARNLVVGDCELVEAHCFREIDYVALGHLHQAQSVGAKIHYSGALMQYSFAEVGCERGVSLVELDAQGESRTQHIPLQPRRPLRILYGSISELLQQEKSTDYIMVRLPHEEDHSAPLQMLRSLFPHILHVERELFFFQEELGSSQPVQGQDWKELFGHFFEEMTGQKLAESQEKRFQQCWQEFLQERREH